jgi:hypothetical protein
MARSKEPVRSMDEAFTAIDGATMTIDGVQGTLHVSRRGGLTRVEHRATAKGRSSDAYSQARKMLGDDYVSDVTDTDEFMDFLNRRVEYVGRRFVSVS